MEETRKDKLQLIVRRFFLIITDIILVNGCVFISLVMRFNVDLAAIESGNVRLSLNAVDIHAMLCSVLSLSQERIREKRIKINFNCPLDIGWMVADDSL